MRCKYLFCDKEAVSKLTAPRIESNCPLCAEHLSEMLEWAKPLRKRPGAVTVEPVAI